MEPGGVDPGFWIARADLASGDVGSGVNRKMDRDRQIGEVQSVAFDHHLLPRRAIDAFDWSVVLASFAESCRERARLHPHGGGDQPSVAGEIGNDRHLESLDAFKDDNGAAAGAFEFKDGRGDVEFAPDRFADAYDLPREVTLHHC